MTVDDIAVSMTKQNNCRRGVSGQNDSRKNVTLPAKVKRHISTVKARPRLE